MERFISAMGWSGPWRPGLRSGPCPAALHIQAQAEVRLCGSAGHCQSVLNRLRFAGLNYLKIINFHWRKQVVGVEEEI